MSPGQSTRAALNVRARPPDRFPWPRVVRRFLHVAVSGQTGAPPRAFGKITGQSRGNAPGNTNPRTQRKRNPRGEEVPTPPGQPPSPSASPARYDPLAAVRGRILLHVKGGRHAPLDSVAKSPNGGVVFSGVSAAERLADFVHRHGTSCPTVLDPAAYERSVASPESPFDLGSRDPALFGSDTPSLLRARAPRGPSPDLALTPTRYLKCDDHGREALARAVSVFASVRAERLVLAVPIDEAWLDHGADALITLLRGTSSPKALILGGKRDPLSSKKKAQALRRIVRSCPDTGLVRTDLAAFDAVLHGASFASIGDTPSVRHTVPPDADPPHARQGSPAVLYPPMMGYFRGATLIGRSLSWEVCHCSACSQWADDHGHLSGGHRFEDFQDSADTALAHAHNLAVWNQWWTELTHGASPEEARRRWGAKCHNAQNEYGWHNRAIPGSRTLFTKPGALGCWAQRPDRPT